MPAQQAPERVTADPAQETGVTAQACQAHRDIARGTAWPGVEPLARSPSPSLSPRPSPSPRVRLRGPGYQVNECLTRHNDHGGISPDPRGISDVRK